MCFVLSCLALKHSAIPEQQELLDASLVAVDKVNKEGGLLPDVWGGPFALEPIIRNGEGNATKFAEQAFSLYHDAEVVVLFGGVRPAERRAASQVFAFLGEL